MQAVERGNEIWNVACEGPAGTTGTYVSGQGMKWGYRLDLVGVQGVRWGKGGMLMKHKILHTNKKKRGPPWNYFVLQVLSLSFSE